jgi:FtsP/CotA-like multicopper oxidase with cupredoxin domain
MMFFLFVAATVTALTTSDRAEVNAADCRHLPATPARSAMPNDNRVRAGTLRDGVLTVRLVARTSAWRPDGANGCALAVHAFAEEGRAAQVPGPLLRVRAGTEVRLRVRNTLDAPIWMRGLQDRAAGVALDSAEIAPGTTRDFQFVAKTPGSWIYWAGGAASRLIAGDAFGQLVGAMIVDSANAPAHARAGERVLVLTRWKADGKGDNDSYQLNAFNGLSWPSSERLRYTVGDSVRWRVLNATNAVHEMHLHGFFFRLEARGFALDTVGVPQPGVGDMRVTSVLRPGEWLTMSWSADRAGNWLFHCHLVTHMSGNQRLDRMSGAAAVESNLAHEVKATVNRAHHDMGGLVLGLEVRPAEVGHGGVTVAREAAVPPRSIALFANARPRTFGEKDGFGFVMQEGPSAPARDSIRIPGSPLILVRGEPVRIAVHNRLSQPISVHWHGLELESYFDGVGGFSGAGARVAPAIAPNDSFIVRLTPPRAGTYMYHVHGERGEELASGLYGPLLVVDSSRPYDPRTERVFVIADGGPGSRKPLFINGSATPDTMVMVVGTAYRLRFIYITANNVVLTTLRSPAGPVTVRRLAFDGHDQTPVISFPMRVPLGPGHTVDFEYTPTAPGELALDVGYAPSSGVTNVAATTMPIRLRIP